MKNFENPTNQKQYFIRIFTKISFYSAGISCTDIEAIIWVWHMMTGTWSNCHHYWFSFIFFQTEYLQSMFARCRQAVSASFLQTPAQSVESLPNEKLFCEIIFSQINQMFFLRFNTFVVPSTNADAEAEFWMEAAEKDRWELSFVTNFVSMREISG